MCPYLYFKKRKKKLAFHKFWGLFMIEVLRALASSLLKKKKNLFSYTKNIFYFNIAFDNTLYITCSNFMFYSFIYSFFSFSTNSPIIKCDPPLPIIRGGKIGHDPWTRHDTTRNKQVMGWDLMGSYHIWFNITDLFNKWVGLMLNPWNPFDLIYLFN